MNASTLINLFKSLTLLLLLSLQHVQAIELTDHQDTSPEREYARALGIYDSFGRWNQTVKLGYNPANAPSSQGNSFRFLGMLKEAAARWQKVSGIRVEVLTPANFQDDMSGAVSNLDQIVSVTWVSSAENFSGRVAPRRGNYDARLGYYPYLDGAITLNSRSNTWENHTRAMRTLTHEIGHLLGLGHSDNPGSMMFANPYNTLQYPTEDDIRAVQTLYGQPTDRIDPSSAQREWVYRALPKASTSYLATSSITAEDSTLTNSIVDASTREDGWLRLETPVNNRRSEQPLNRDVELVLIDPYGYVYSRRVRSLSCPAEKYCRPWTGVIQMDVLKQLPGNWQVHINDIASHQLLQSLNFTVNTQPVFNLPPSARVVVARTGSDSRIQIKVVAEDAENDQISVKWNSTESPEILGSDGISAWRTLHLNYSGINTFFIEVNDDAKRYAGSASTTASGSGFRTLLRLDIKLPFSGTDAIQVASSDLYSYEEDASKLLTYYRLNGPVYQPSRTWPAPYNGITPPLNSGIDLNNIGVLDDMSSTLFSCVNIVNNGSISHLDGIEQFDIIFNLLNFSAGTIRVTNTRKFNETGALNESFESPDCSGFYDLSSQIFSDTILVDQQIYNVEFVLSDPDNLTFTLTAAERLR